MVPTPINKLSNSRNVSQDLEAHFKAKGKAVTHETIEEFAWETLNSGKVRTPPTKYNINRPISATFPLASALPRTAHVFPVPVEPAVANNVPANQSWMVGFFFFCVFMSILETTFVHVLRATTEHTLERARESRSVFARHLFRWCDRRSSGSVTLSACCARVTRKLSCRTRYFGTRSVELTASHTSCASYFLPLAIYESPIASGDPRIRARRAPENRPPVHGATPIRAQAPAG